MQMFVKPERVVEFSEAAQHVAAADRAEQSRWEIRGACFWGWTGEVAGLSRPAAELHPLGGSRQKEESK